ncbi:hypothetical protein ACJMK2_039776 [Sinanodonta woodiana]|uniref:Uncharacterized protein n=1 Tax=Sinanodonta woodiana TaxID=1069815 RepID=A0ABD3WD12_SINWO
MNSWNNHKLRTENNKILSSYLYLDCSSIFNEDKVIANEYFEELDQDALPEYGMDPDAPLPEPSDEDYIGVPSIQLLNEEQLYYFSVKMRGINVAILSDIEPYLHALESVNEVLEV